MGSRIARKWRNLLGPQDGCNYLPCSVSVLVGTRYKEKSVLDAGLTAINGCLKLLEDGE